MSKLSPWTIPEAATPYLSIFRTAEQQYDLPQNLLVRMAQQESYFDPNAVSPVGAEGIMQLMPQYYPNIDPFDVTQAVFAAAQTMKQYYKQFGSWKKALAAYNWGPGNVQKYGITNLPAETANYVADIGGDLHLA